jgi:hypothetical protein
MNDESSTETSVAQAIEPIRVRVLQASVHSADEIASVLMAAQTLKKLAGEIEATAKQKALVHIEVTGEDLVIGTTRYYAGVRKVTKCQDKAGTLEAIFRAAGGDMERAVEFFASEPFKHGQLRRDLPPAEYDLLFVVEEKVELVEGKPRKHLLAVNEAFTK